jgi:group I intron endonuclease
MIRTGIYKIVNKNNNNNYYGSAQISLFQRWKDHKRDLKRGIHKNKHLQSAWNLYGADAFKFEIILECPPEECLMYEQMCLDLYWDNCVNCYNIEQAVGYPMLGRHHTEETKQRISKAQKGRPSPLKGRKGKPHTDSTKKKMSETRKGRVLTKEHRQKLSEAGKGHKHSEETKQKMRDAKKHISAETRNKLSEANRRRQWTDESKKKLSEFRKAYYRNKKT